MSGILAALRSAMQIWASVLEELDAMGGVMRDGFMSPAR